MGKIFDGIIHYEELHEYEPEIVIVGKVLFMKDFGPWVAGTRCLFIRICYETGTISQIVDDY